MRLDSWKAIANHLGKDESTVRRWERELGLPVRRVQGAPGRSVFAYKEELDAWMTARSENTADVPPKVVEKSEPDRIEPPNMRSSARPVVPMLATVFVLIAIAAVWSRAQGSRVAAASMNGGNLIGRDAGGAELWRLPLSAEEQPAGLYGRNNPIEVLNGGAVLAAAGVWIRPSDEKIRGGSLIEASPSGAIARQFTFDDTIRFGGGSYGPPWVLSDYRVSPPGGPRHIAVVAHHFEWWPSVLTILDESAAGPWQRRATFVNAGWIEHLYWLSPSRLLVSGFNEALNGGVVALFDANAMDGQLRAPDQDSKFDCLGCPPVTPIRYFVMPRTEVNVTTGSRFNRASVDVKDNGFVVRTIEVEQDGQLPAADALYDFSPEWTLRSVTFSSRYWEIHEALWRAGKLDHDGQHCPQRKGPPIIHQWDGKWTVKTLQ